MTRNKYFDTTIVTWTTYFDTTISQASLIVQIVIRWHDNPRKTPILIIWRKLSYQGNNNRPSSFFFCFGSVSSYYYHYDPVILWNLNRRVSRWMVRMFQDLMAAFILIQVQIRHLPLRLLVQQTTVGSVGIHILYYLCNTCALYLIRPILCCHHILFFACAFSPLFFSPIFLSLLFFIYCFSFSVLLFVLSFSFPLSFIFVLDGMFVLGFDHDIYSN